ncbi:alkane 1-monooxygenase [Ramlibacter monticola]
MVNALGYLAVFLPFALLFAGLSLGIPYLAAAVVFGAGPLLRLVLGNASSELPEWGERTATLLDRLPTLYAMAFPFLLAGVAVELYRHPPAGVAGWIGLGLSLWTCLFFAVVVAHELIHGSPRRRRLGWLLAGAAGYPLLAHEHLSHHATSGNVHLAEWPRRTESVWSFAARRSVRIVRSAIEYNAILAARGRRSAVHGGLIEAIAATLGTVLAFALAAGFAGLALILCVAAGVHFGVQAVTYLQHWGLGVDSVDDADERRYAWEDRCQFQVWLMLHLALHHAHHQNSSVPYYRLAPHPGSPRLPAGYVVLLLASFVPPLWRWLMIPALENWKRDPLAQVEPVRWRLVCLPANYEPRLVPRQ